MNNKRKSLMAFAAICAAVITTVSMTGCKNDSAESSQAVDVLEPVEETTEVVLPEIENFASSPDGMTGYAKSLLSHNGDVVGYIKIDNTLVDYPVVQYNGEDLDEQGNAYYMDKDIYGNYLESGSIFMDYRDNFPPDENEQSENIVLYGHNMLNGSKFATLHYYRQDNAFYDESPIIEFSSNYKDYKYIIFGYFVTSGSYGESNYGPEFAYWDMENMDEEEFNEYVSVVKERSMISPDIDVKYGDQLLTLQTCHLDEDNSRFIVIARRLRDNETVDSIDKAE